jgi:hypothetical protein
VPPNFITRRDIKIPTNERSPAARADGEGRV